MLSRRYALALLCGVGVSASFASPSDAQGRQRGSGARRGNGHAANAANAHARSAGGPHGGVPSSEKHSPGTGDHGPEAEFKPEFTDDGRPVPDILFQYEDGWIERILSGRYELFDDVGRRVILRLATQEDYDRMRDLDK